MNHLILLKNKSVVMKSNIQKLIKTKYKEIEFILFNLKDTNSTFLLHKVYDYMKKFKKAEISVEMVVVRNSMEKDIKLEAPDYTRMKSIQMEISKLDDFISYLHSLNKIRYTNKLANSNESSDYDIICFTEFSIKIFDNKSCIYKNKLIGVLSPSDILQSIKKIYNPVLIEDSYISINNSAWRMTNNFKERDALYGICYPYTKSYEFFHIEVFNALSVIKSVYCASFVYDDKNVDISDIDVNELCQFNFISGSLRFHDIWYPKPQYYLEYISYIGTIQTNLSIASELAEFGEINNKMVMDTQILIESITEKNYINSIQYRLKSPNIITIPEFINLLKT